MTIRRYRPGEESAIWSVVFSATRESNARDYHPDLIARWAPIDKDMTEWGERLKSMKPFVALIDDKVVGMAEFEASGFIDYFYVDPNFQSRGIGKALLASIEAEASALGVSKVFANVSVTAKPFFSSRGFEVTEARSNVILGHAAPNFAMTKHLNSERGGAEQPTTRPESK